MATTIDKLPSGNTIELALDPSLQEDDISELIPITQLRIRRHVDGSCALVWSGNSDDSISISTTNGTIEVAGIVAIDDNDLYTKLKALL